MRSAVKDPATFVGILVAFILVIIAIVINGDGDESSIDFASMVGFLDVRSILIVVAGTMAVVTACYSFAELKQLQGLVARTIFYNAENPSDTATRSLELAEIARKNDALGLEKYEEMAEHNHFLHKGLRMIIDGAEKNTILRVINEDIHAMRFRHDNGVSMLLKSAEIAPAMGLIGTLVGLVKMLGNLEDPSTIGPSMAVALLTTFYGAMLSYMVFTPLASKLERNSKAEESTARIYLKTLESIIDKENPRKLEATINSMLAPDKRIQYYEEIER